MISFHRNGVVIGPFTYWPPWSVTRPWLPRAFRGGDEWHNPSWALILPFLGAFIWFRLDWPRVDGGQHLYARFMGAWEGVDQPGCLVCAEVRSDFESDFETEDPKGEAR